MQVIYTLVILGFLSLLELNAQSLLTEEIEPIANSLINQLNRSEEIQTVAITDFTDLAYEPNLLGKLLAEELTTSLFMNMERNFDLIDRNQLNRLLEEVKLDAKGLLAPENIPRLGKLKSIDAIIGATMSQTSQSVRIIVKGIELETGDMVAASKGYISLTPSLIPLLSPIQGSNQPIEKRTNSSNTYTQKKVTIEKKGLDKTSNGVVVNLQVSISGPSSNLSFFTNQSYILTNNTGKTQADYIQLGEKSARSRVSKILYPDSPESLSIRFPNNSGPFNKLLLTCHSNESGLIMFEISL
ncbi:MAG: FlgO family outer membrane protein [Bacteroidota bacterium]